MTTIGQNFPMTRKARKEKLDQIKTGPSISMGKVPGKGAKPVYRIPLECLSYNPYNTRFLAQAKTLEKRFGQDLSDENPAHILEIEEFIMDEKKDHNKNTINSLIKDGQLQHGVVTADGIILAGNRRFRLLNEIIRNPDKYNSERIRIAGLEYFEAVILDEDELDKKEIIRYESFYQFGMEDKVEYNPIQKYIAANDQKMNLGFTEQEIADNFATDKKNIEKRLTVFDLMNEYLEYIGESGIYTALEGREEAFLQLEGLLKSYRKKSGSILWAFDENDLSDLKLVFFDYIRLNTPTHDFRIFKDIFADESQWKKFKKEQNEIVDKPENCLNPFDEYRVDYPEDDESKISKRRENDYKQKTAEKLKDLYDVGNAQVHSKKAQKKPMDILNSIQQELSKLEIDMTNNQNNKTFRTDEFIDAIKDVQNRITRIEQQIERVKG